MSRIKNNGETLKEIGKLFKECGSSGIEETKVVLLQSIFYILQDISISLAIIADKKGKFEMTKEQFKAKAKEIIDNEPFGELKLFDYDDINAVCVAQIYDIDKAHASYPLMDFLDELYEQIKGDMK